MERCPEHDSLAQDIKDTKKETQETRVIVAGMSADLVNAIKEVKEHIQGGSKWRLTIACACIGLVGLFLAGLIKFAVNDYRVSLHDRAIEDLKIDNRDLNFEMGKMIGENERRTPKQK